MKIDTLIRGGTVVSPAGMRQADVAICGERIAAVETGAGRQKLRQQAAENGASTVDASGKYVLPGVIDVHVHLALPFCGTVSSDDYDSGTKAAARGGVTTLIDFAVPYGRESLQDAVDNWHARAEGKTCIDYSFHVCITDGDRHIKEIPKIIDQGFPTFKEFMIYASQGWQSNDATMFKTLELLRDLDGMLLVHAESSSVLDELIERHHNRADMQKYGARLHTMTRPNFVETEAIQRAITWSEVTGGQLYIVHMSTGQGADLIQAARQRKIKVLAETCAQYLALDDSRFAGKDGHLYATCPQLKSISDQRRLWKGVKDGEVCIVSTDTCTFTREQKAMWKGDFTKIPMGMPGLETLLPVVYTQGVLAKKITLKQMVDRLCQTPAKVMGMYPQKGVIKRGSDADIAIIDPDKRIKVDWRKMETNADWSPFQGWSLAGFAEKTFSRGTMIVDNYKFIGQNGHGRFVARSNPGWV